MIHNPMRHTEILKDPKFISWQLAPDESLEEYWQKLLYNNPDLEIEVSKAIKYLKANGLNKSDLTPKEKEELLNRIHKTYKLKSTKNIKIRYLKYTIAGCIATALLIFGISLLIKSEQTNLDILNDGLIAGELLQNEDIQFVTDESTKSYNENINIILDKNGNAEITQKNKNSEKLDIKTKAGKLNSLIVPFGKRTTITLSDGSRVWVNSGSVLEFSTLFNGDKREIFLSSGEVYIEVAKDNDKPFYVNTKDYKIRVYGTSFNVSSYNNYNSSVALVEGKVSLIKPGSTEEFHLTPNEMATFNNTTETFKKETVEIINHVSWKDGYLSLEKTPMIAVLSKIERYYNISFDFDRDVNLQNRTCSGKIYLSEDIDNVMTTIALLTSTRYRKEKNNIYITNEFNYNK